MANDGVSARTKKGLVETGALSKEDVGGGTLLTSPTPKFEAPAKGIGKQVSQSEYDDMQKAQKAKADANYLKYKQKR
jgi:hypothetical protein